jgi:hypothetical protein
MTTITLTLEDETQYVYRWEEEQLGIIDCYLK